METLDVYGLAVDMVRRSCRLNKVSPLTLWLAQEAHVNLHCAKILLRVRKYISQTSSLDHRLAGQFSFPHSALPGLFCIAVSLSLCTSQNLLTRCDILVERSENHLWRSRSFAERWSEKSGLGTNFWVENVLAGNPPYRFLKNFNWLPILGCLVRKSN